MLNTDIKVNLKHAPKVDMGEIDARYDRTPDDAKYELYASVAEYVHAVAPGKKFDVTKTGAAVVNFINEYLCLNPDNIPNCVQVAKVWDELWDELDKAFNDIANDNKWHNTKHVDEPGLKIDEWVKKHIG